jgi:putative PIN family toxin of toxin-antitoxin system
MMLIVLDTNVLVSGLLKAEGYPGMIVDLLLEDRVRIAYDDRILGEYEDVLNRPELHIPPPRAKAITAYIELTGQYIETEKLSFEDFPDIDDIPFAEVLISSNAQALITGNRRHFQKLEAVYSPAEFIETFFSPLHSPP